MTYIVVYSIKLVCTIFQNYQIKLGQKLYWKFEIWAQLLTRKTEVITASEVMGTLPLTSQRTNLSFPPNSTIYIYMDSMGPLWLAPTKLLLCTSPFLLHLQWHRIISEEKEEVNTTFWNESCFVKYNRWTEHLLWSSSKSSFCYYFSDVRRFTFSDWNFQNFYSFHKEMCFHSLILEFLNTNIHTHKKG